MTTLKYAGRILTDADDAAYHGYLKALKNSDLTTEQIDAALDLGLSSYATKSYVDTKEGTLASQAYVDAQDNLRVKLNQKDVLNGVPGLDSGGRVNPGRINLPADQKYNRGPWSPSAYNAVTQFAGTETTLYTCSITDPGYPYKLIVFGDVDVTSSLAAEYPIVYVRAGGTAGEIIAQGAGLADSYTLPTSYGDNFNAGFDSAKWSTVSTTGKSNIVVTSGAVDTPSGGRCSQWIGTTVGTDDIAITFDLANRAIGDTSVIMHADGTSWTSWTSFVASRQGFGHSSYLFSGTSNTLSGGTQRDGLNMSAIGLSWDSITSVTFSYTSSDKTYRVFFDGVQRSSWADTTSIVPKGVGKRKVVVFTGSNTQNGAFGMDNFSISETGSNLMYSPVRIAPVGAAQTVKTGTTTLYVRGIRSGASATMTASAYQPRLFVTAVPA